MASEEASDVEEDYYEEDWKRALRCVLEVDRAVFFFFSIKILYIEQLHVNMLVIY